MEDQSLCLPTLPFHTHCLLLRVFTASSSGNAATVCVRFLSKHLYTHINSSKAVGDAEQIKTLQDVMLFGNNQ